MLLVKKIFCFVVFTFVFNTSSIAEKSIPLETINNVKKEVVLSSTHTILPDGECWFVIAKEENGTNILKCYGLSGDQYSLLFESKACIPQSSKELLIEVERNMEDITTHEIYEFPVLTISQMDNKNEYVELFIAYRYEKIDTWKLMRFWDYSEFGNILIKNGYIQVYEDIETEQPLLLEQFDFDLDIRNLDLQLLMTHINKIVETFQESIDNQDMHG